MNTCVPAAPKPAPRSRQGREVAGASRVAVRHVPDQKNVLPRRASPAEHYVAAQRLVVEVGIVFGGHRLESAEFGAARRRMFVVADGDKRLHVDFKGHVACEGVGASGRDADHVAIERAVDVIVDTVAGGISVLDPLRIVVPGIRIRRAAWPGWRVGAAGSARCSGSSRCPLRCPTY